MDKQLNFGHFEYFKLQPSQYFDIFKDDSFSEFHAVNIDNLLANLLMKCLFIWLEPPKLPYGKPWIDDG